METFAAPKKYWGLYDRDKLPLAPYQKPAKEAPQYALHSWGELKSYSDIEGDGPLSQPLQSHPSSGSIG